MCNESPQTSHASKYLGRKGPMTCGDILVQHFFMCLCFEHVPNQHCVTQIIAKHNFHSFYHLLRLNVKVIK